MRSSLFIVCALVALVLAAGLAQAQQQEPKMVTVDINQLPQAQRDSILEHQYESDIEAKVKKFGWAAGLGKEIGEGVNESLKAITERTAEFAETKVGKFTMFMVAWKILGTDAIQFAFGSVFFLIWIVVWIFSYNRNCIARKVLVKSSKEGGKEWQIVNEWRPNDGNSDRGWSNAITHWIIFVVAIIITCLIIFA